MGERLDDVSDETMERMFRLTGRGKPTEYSDNELKLFEAIGIDLQIVPYIDPPGIYRMCIEKAFCNSMSGGAVEALRRAYIAVFIKCTDYRKTSTFEEMIKF